MPFTEDLGAFFDPTGFGTNATLNGVAVVGIFDNGYEPGLVGAAGMASARGLFRLPTASVPANPVGKPLVVNAVNYTVAEHQPDGTGVSVLHLERA